MEGLTSLAIILALGCGTLALIILSSPENMRRTACWLLARARATEEIRAARHGIRIEQMEHRRRLELEIRTKASQEERMVVRIPRD